MSGSSNAPTVGKVSQQAVGSEVRFAAEDLIAMDGEVVVQVLLFGHGLLDERGKRRLKLVHLARMNLIPGRIIGKAAVGRRVHCDRKTGTVAYRYASC